MKLIVYYLKVDVTVNLISDKVLKIYNALVSDSHSREVAINAVKQGVLCVRS